MKLVDAQISSAILLVATLISGCESDRSTAPPPPSWRTSVVPASNSLPLLVEYSGVVQTGRAIVCTSKFSAVPGHYDIEVLNAKPGDSWAEKAIVSPGSCAVVFETTQTSGLIPQVLVTPSPLSMLSDVTPYNVICGATRTCVPWCYANWDAHFDVFETVTKFYFTKPINGRSADHWPHDPTPALCYSGHGGGGTIDFALD